jgi:hypothetical protein
MSTKRKVYLHGAGDQVSVETDTLEELESLVAPALDDGGEHAEDAGGNADPALLNLVVVFVEDVIHANLVTLGVISLDCFCCIIFSLLNFMGISCPN